jgi:hypothetical protein
MAWLNSSWKYRVKVTVRATQVPSTLTDFPVYLDLNTLPPAFHAYVKTDGSDIRITTSTGNTEVPFEIVYYDSTADLGEIHFKAPSLSSSVDTDFYIYYGNAAASAYAVGATYGAYNVWTTSSSVYHLNETNNTTANGYKNAKANSTHGTGTSMNLALTANTKVGKGATVDGIDDKITISSVFSMGNTNGTISAWFYMPGAVSSGAFIKVGTNANGYAIGVGDTAFDNVGNKLIMIYDSVRWIVTTQVITQGWHFAVMTVSAAGVPSAYLDGTLVGTYAGTNAIAPTTSSVIGGAVTGRNFSGVLDEARYYNSPRTANWILAEYRNQNSPLTFYKVGVQEWETPPADDTPIPEDTDRFTLDIPEYTVELWSSTGVYMADVSTILKSGLRIVMPLNDVEQVDFSLDLVQFEEKCARIGALPRNILDPYRTEVKIKRNGAYLLGTQVVQAQINLNNQGANTIEVRSTGYLNLFKDRYITPGVSPSGSSLNYTGRTYAELAQRLIIDTQSQTNGSQGVTLGPDEASLLQSMTRTRAEDYDNQNVKDGILNLTKLESDNFDFRFTWDKRFECFDRIGEDKPDIELVYPQNIVSMTIVRDASTLANKITGIGSGMGEERLTDTEIDATSALTYGVREKIELFNSVSNQATLDTNVNGLLPFYKDIYEIPAINVTNGAINPGEVVVGDAVQVRVEESTFVTSINDMYRIIEMSINLSNNMEENISLKLAPWA